MLSNYSISDSAEQAYEGILDSSIQLILTDPPFGTGKRQKLRGNEYEDSRAAALGNIEQLAKAAERILTPDGVLAVILDYRLVHEAHGIIGKHLTPHGELIWHFMLGAVARNWWTNKHNTILLFDRGWNGLFQYDKVRDIPRLATRGGYDASKPKKQDSVITYTMSQSSGERCGYPSQKPVEVLDQVIQVHTRPGDVVLDPFMGSGSTGVAALRAGRRFVGADVSEDARRIAVERLQNEG